MQDLQVTFVTHLVDLCARSLLHALVRCSCKVLVHVKAFEYPKIASAHRPCSSECTRPWKGNRFMSPRPRKSLENLRYLRKKNSSGPEHEAPKFKRGDAEGTEGIIEGWADPERQDLSPQSAHDLRSANMFLSPRLCPQGT